MNFAARNGWSEPADTGLPMNAPPAEKKLATRRTGMKGETFAYSYLRGQGYVMVARNHTAPPMKGEIDRVGWAAAGVCGSADAHRVGNPGWGGRKTR